MAPKGSCRGVEYRAMIFPHSNETQTSWDHGKYQVQLTVPNNTRPIGYCDGSAGDVAELRALAEAEGSESFRIDKKRLKSGRDLDAARMTPPSRSWRCRRASFSRLATRSVTDVGAPGSRRRARRQHSQTRATRHPGCASSGVSSLALLLVASCDAPKKRKSGRQVEGTTEPTIAEIEVWLTSKGMKVGAVTCPPTVPVEKGYAFECHAAVDGGSQTTPVRTSGLM